jgi:hypothetical protein
MAHREITLQNCIRILPADSPYGPMHYEWVQGSDPTYWRIHIRFPWALKHWHDCVDWLENHDASPGVAQAAIEGDGTCITIFRRSSERRFGLVEAIIIISDFIEMSRPRHYTFDDTLV